MDWHERMQAMINKVETNLEPGREYAIAAPAPRHAVVHVDRHNEAPLQHQVYELDNRVRVCFNELADMKIAVEKNSRSAIDTTVTQMKEELKKDISTLDKQTADDVRILSHELRCRVADVEQTFKEEKRKKDDHKKHLRNRDEQQNEMFEQMRDVTTRLATKVEILEAEVRNRSRDLTKADDDRFEDMRNEVRYQGERMEEAKRQMGLRMDKVADAVHQEVLGMTDIVRGMVKDVWKEHMTVVYSKINESLDTFNSTLNRQVTTFKELDTYARSNQSLVEAEISKIHDTTRSLQHRMQRSDHDLGKHNEMLGSHKAQLLVLQRLPDDVSRVQIDNKRVNEAMPLLEAALRKQTVITEVVKDMPEKTEELRWEIKKVNELFARHESTVSDVCGRVKTVDNSARAACESVSNMKTAMAADQNTLNKNTKRLLNTVTKVSELEEEDGRKAAAIERLKHQIQEHQTSLRTLMPQVTNLSCQVDATKLQLDPRVSNTETQMQEMWAQFRELQIKVSGMAVQRYTERSPGTLQVSQPSDAHWNEDKRTNTGPALMLSDISHSPAVETTFTSREEEGSSLKPEAMFETEQKKLREQQDQQQLEMELVKERKVREQEERERHEQAERERNEREQQEKEARERQEREFQEREQRQEQERLMREKQEIEKLEQQERLKAEQARLKEEETRRQQERLEQETKEREVIQQREEERAKEEETKRVHGQRASEVEKKNEVPEIDESGTRSIPEVPVLEDSKDADHSSDHVASFEIDTEGKEERNSDDKVVSFEEPREKTRSSDESTVITLSTGVTSASSKRSRYSKKTSSRRSSAKSSEFKLDAKAEDQFPTFPAVSSALEGRPKGRPGSILAQTSGSEMERPVIKGFDMRITSPENTDGEPPEDEVIESRSSKSRRSGKSTEKSDISLPE
eukprot:TRINITY_DN13085_c0_g2_i1.p1 TRINITY_DN13085_c0_g2~~TRINITY_DN13085_c0_g2_i1.p1  ORF type:complete len:917 (+),score=211.75 TRINITY_DN13085_c0_g2_i1:44-2794(+)